MLDTTTEDQTPEPMDTHVGGRIWRRRREMGLSRRELGERIGIGLKQVNKYETGANRVSAGRLFEISRVLGVPAAYFFDDYDASNDPGPTADDFPDGIEIGGDSHEIRAILEVYHAMPAEVRSRFLRLVRAIADSGQ